MFRLSIILPSPLIIFVLLLVSFAVYALYQFFFHPLRHVPGPRLSALTALDHHIFRYLRGYEHHTDRALHEKYGNVVRIAPNTVLVKDPEVLRSVYGGRIVVKTDYYTAVDWNKYAGVEGVASVFHETGYEGHKRARKRVAAPFSNSNVQSYRPIVEARADTWIAKLGEFADAGKNLDIGEWVEYLAYDAISELCFGAPFGFIKEGKDIHGLIGEFHGALPFVSSMMRFAWLIKLLKWSQLGRFMMPKPGDDSGVGRIMQFRNDKLRERLSSSFNHDHSVNKPDILSYLLTSNAKSDAPLAPGPFRAHLENNLMLFMIAGTDTTASTLRFMFLTMHQQPVQTRKLLLPNGKVDGRYLQAFLRETMRLYHPAASYFPRFAPPGGVSMSDGTFIPEGTIVTTQTWALHRDNNGVFGPDAETFRPERWLVDDEEAEGETEADRVRRLEKETYTWGYGGRTCLGRGIAEMEMLVGVTKFLETFEWEFVNPDRPYERLRNFNIIIHKNMPIRIWRRGSK